MSKYFAPNPGELEINADYGKVDKLDVVQWHEDNEIWLRPITFSVLSYERDEFQITQSFRDIVQYVENCRKKRQEKVATKG